MNWPAYAQQAYTLPAAAPPARILLISTRQIGDALLTTPLLRTLRRAWPNAQIDALVLCGKGEILAGNPDLATVLCVPEKPRVREHWALLKKVWRRYDLAISTLSGDRPSLYAWAAAAQRVGIVPPPEPGQGFWKRWLFQGWTALDDRDTPTVIQNLRLADVLGIARDYTVVLPEQPDSAARLDALLPFAWRDTPYAVLHLAPMWTYKRWTLSGWASLANQLQQRGWQLILSGGPGAEEQAYLRAALTQGPPGMHNLAGQLRFADLGLLLQHSRLYVGPDTAVTHLAAASGCPTVALFGPTNPLKWAPWPHAFASDACPVQRIGTFQRQGNLALVQGVADCVPCHQEGCDRHRASHSRCLDELAGATVIQAVDRLLRALAAETPDKTA